MSTIDKTATVRATVTVGMPPPPPTKGTIAGGRFRGWREATKTSYMSSYNSVFTFMSWHSAIAFVCALSVNVRSDPASDLLPLQCASALPSHF